VSFVKVKSTLCLRFQKKTRPTKQDQQPLKTRLDNSDMGIDGSATTLLAGAVNFKPTALTETNLRLFKLNSEGRLAVRGSVGGGSITGVV
jgi:hypothetical protein